MKSEMRENSGILFKNDKSGGNEKWPDYKGEAVVGGERYWLAAWVKEGKRGKFMSIALKPKDQKRAAPAPANEPVDDNQPF